MGAWVCGMCRRPCTPGKRLCSTCRGDVDAQLAIFDSPRPGDYRSTDPRTSRKAAAANLSKRQSQKKSILKAMLDGPLTLHEAAEFTGGQRGSASKRLGELEAEGLASVCGEVKAPGQTPRSLYWITDAGRRDAALMGVAS